MKNKKISGNLIFTGVILLAALALFAFNRWQAAQGGQLYAHLQYDTNPLTGSFQEMDIPLEKNARYDLVSGDYTIHLQVQDKTIAFVDSPCPDHLCENQFGKLSKKGDYAACMPAGAVVTIMSKDGK